jgi:hypothetical protein
VFLFLYLAICYRWLVLEFLCTFRITINCFCPTFLRKGVSLLFPCLSFPFPKENLPLTDSLNLPEHITHYFLGTANLPTKRKAAQQQAKDSEHQ